MKEITSLDEIKRIELSIMKRIHCICEEEKLTYFLSFGTLIGAVRHKGFIPWDDDIDIYMPRNDYDKLVEIIKFRGEIQHLSYANPFSKIRYGRNLTKVFDTDTVLTEPQYKTDDPIGVFVDVWPLDGTPNNPLLRRVCLSKALILKKMILASSMYTNREYSLIRNLGISFASHVNHDNLTRKLDRLSRKYAFSDSNYVFCYSAQDAIYDRHLFSERILWSFEDTEFYIPKEYDKILRLEFGEYMVLPPEEERIPHHVINTFYK